MDVELGGSSLLRNMYGSTAEKYSSFSNKKGTGKEEKGKILKYNQKPTEEEAHLTCDKPSFEFLLQRRFTNSAFVILNWVTSPSELHISFKLIRLEFLFWIIENPSDSISEKAIKFKLLLKETQALKSLFLDENKLPKYFQKDSVFCNKELLSISELPFCFQEI